MQHTQRRGAECVSTGTTLTFRWATTIVHPLQTTTKSRYFPIRIPTHTNFQDQLHFTPSEPTKRKALVIYTIFTIYYCALIRRICTRNFNRISTTTPTTSTTTTTATTVRLHCKKKPITLCVLLTVPVSLYRGIGRPPNNFECLLLLLLLPVLSS